MLYSEDAPRDAYIAHLAAVSLQSCFLPSPSHPRTWVNLSQNLRVNSAVMSTRPRAATTIGGVFDRPGQVAQLAKPRLDRPQCSPPAPGLDSLSANHDKSPLYFLAMVQYLPRTAALAGPSTSPHTKTTPTPFLTPSPSSHPSQSPPWQYDPPPQSPPHTRHTSPSPSACHTPQ